MGDGAGSAELTVVGSGTLVPDPLRGSASHHLLCGAASVLFDCGPGTLHGLARCGVDWRSLTHVFVTHFHNDHLADLVPLLVALKHAGRTDRDERLVLAGPAGFTGLLQALATAHGEYVDRQGFTVEVVELGAEPLDDDDVGVRFRAFPTPHTAESVCVRAEGPWGSVGYTGDTGPSEGVGEALRGVSVLVSECTHTDPTDDPGHLSPSRVAELARRVSPELVVVTHVMPPFTPEEAAAAIARAYRGRVLPGADGLRMRISTGGVTVDPPPGAA